MHDVLRRANALVTASYKPDLERCRLLCETVDRYVTGHSHHYILVASEDVALFRQLEGPKRTVVDERDLLPSWLRSFPDPFFRFRKRVWLSLRTMPLRGWHVQQLRRIAIAHHVGEEALIYCDSDVAFLRPFDCRSFWNGGDLRLFRREGALAGDGLDDQRLWASNAGKVLGLSAPPRNDYIATVIAWRRDATTTMCRRIEEITGRHWVAGIASNRHFSECMIYGRYADEVLEGQGHFHASNELCRVYWTGPALSDDEFREFVAAMSPDQVAIGMQSFIGTDIGRIRRLIEA
ncbi:DUF6492 family protein [Mesorhizobium australicum]|uniref:Uncharacterized protein n=1 Tax=Mesorhizobium australicum TaxID=536018 RepID=A0A1X7NML3_9HYPH|nr:DUF6492 family protein [Mesorhizobium australicum]SMH39223.1 hypothetical protein SAMN02982922_2142 [Mesorhizobium australicum]